MPYYFASSHSHSWGRRRNGSTPTNIEILHGTTAPLPSQQSFFPQEKTNALHGRISSFQQQHDESILEAWEHFQDYISECPRHGMQNWLLMQTFYHGLTNSTCENMDAATGGAFLSLTILGATALVQKMASNLGWNEEHLQTHKRGGGMHQLKDVDMLSANMDLLIKKPKTKLMKSNKSYTFMIHA